LIMAFGQVKAATRLTGMELRQFTEAGVPLLDILAKQMGKTTAEMVEMISDGKVGFPEVEKAIFGMSAEGGKFFNLMERQSKTFDGVMSNLRDNIGRVARNVIGLTDTGEVVKGGFFDKLSTAASNLLMWFDKNRESIIAFLQNGLNVLLSVGQQVINVVTTLYGWVKTLIDGFRSGEGTFGYVAAIFQTIWDWIKQVADTIKGPLIEAWERMKSAVQPILPLLQALAVVFGAILFGAIMGFISLLGFLIETVSRIFSGIVQIVSGALQVIQGLFEIVTGFFIGLLTGDWEQFRQGWANLWNGIKNIFVGAWNAITGIFQAAWNAVKNIFTTMFNFLIGHSIVPDIVNGIIGWFSRIPSGIANALRNVGSAIASPFQRGFDLIKAGVDKVRGFLQRINPFHRESPSLVDNITKGVDVILRQYDKIASMEIQRPIVPEPILSSQPVANTGSSIIVNIERSLIANDAAAQDIGELVGDAILKKLHNSVKV
jgi:tape measure domain-containing protein